MAEYRAYAIGEDGLYVSFETLDCVDDADAIETAKRLIIGRDIELWCGPRFVIRISHKPTLSSQFLPSLSRSPANIDLACRLLGERHPPSFRSAQKYRIAFVS